MALIRYSDEDRRRMREHADEQREIHAEWDRLCLKYAEVAHNPTTPAEIERERRLMRVRQSLQIRPHGES
jgi:hypothetical protein